MSNNIDIDVARTRQTITLAGQVRRAVWVFLMYGIGSVARSTPDPRDHNA